MSGPVRRRHGGAPALAPALALASALALALAGCSSSPGRGGTTSTTTLSSATTTTLPVPTGVQGSTVTSPFSLLGTAQRVPVPDVPGGASSGPLPVPGQPGYAAVEWLAYRSFGSGPPLLLVMGQDGSMTWWDPSFLLLLAQHYRVTIFDLPGVGYSAPLATRLTLDLMADETAGLIQSLGLSRPAVLGWGLGGSVAVALAERHSGMIGSLALVDAIAGGTSPEASPAMQRRVGSVWATAASLAGVFFSPRHHLERGHWLQMVRALPPDPLTQAAVDAEAHVVADLDSSDSLVAALGGVDVPTLVVDGSADRIVAPGDSAVIASGIPGARRIVYPGADYGSLFEEKTAFVAALEQFTG